MNISLWWYKLKFNWSGINEICTFMCVWAFVCQINQSKTICGKYIDTFYKWKYCKFRRRNENITQSLKYTKCYNISAICILNLFMMEFIHSRFQSLHAWLENQIIFNKMSENQPWMSITHMPHIEFFFLVFFICIKNQMAFQCRENESYAHDIKKYCFENEFLLQH